MKDKGAYNNVGVVHGYDTLTLQRVCVHGEYDAGRNLVGIFLREILHQTIHKISPGRNFVV